MVKSNGIQVVSDIQEVYSRYEWLKAKLLMKYNIYYDGCFTGEEIIAVNEWYEKMEKYLGKRFCREFTRAVNKARKAKEETVVC